MSCVTCGNQGRVWAPVRRPNGDLIGHTPEPCPTCHGDGVPPLVQLRRLAVEAGDSPHALAHLRDTVIRLTGGGK